MEGGQFEARLENHLENHLEIDIERMEGDPCCVFYYAGFFKGNRDIR